VSGRVRELLAIMARLRGPDGCAWDRQQTFASIAPHTIEEAYEVADAVEGGDMEQLRGELGDLLFQVVFQSQIASEAGQFDFDAVAGAICEKLIRRHPHVFGGAPVLNASDQGVAWEDIKAKERGGEDASALAGVPNALPALMRADKLSKRAARVGFDFEQADQSADKVAEELAEVREAAARGTSSAAQAASNETFEEIGDLLFAAANLARKLNVDSEAALRAANLKFERRFRGMESLALKRGEKFSQLNLAAQEALWQSVKRGE
jgi:nucleoside triphosphate diphosphatase